MYDYKHFEIKNNEYLLQEKISEKILKKVNREYYRMLYNKK